MPKNWKSKSSAQISFDEQNITVGRLSIDDLAVLRREHVVKLLETIDAYKELFTHPGEIQRTYGALAVIIEMSDGIAHLISLSNPEIDRNSAAALPVGAQVRALIEIATQNVGHEIFDGAAPQLINLLGRRFGR